MNKLDVGTKRFHVGDLLSVTTGRLLSPSGIDGVYCILSYMTGQSVMTHQIPRAIDECRPHLNATLPMLCSPHINLAIRQLDASLIDDKYGPIKEVINDWMRNLLDSKYGVCVNEFYDIKPIASPRLYDPFAEVVGMAGPEQTVIKI